MLRSCEKDGIELADASADLAGLVERAGGIEPILRGAAYSRTRAVDASFATEVSVSSLLFNLPVEVVNRGRDHGAKYKFKLIIQVVYVIVVSIRELFLLAFALCGGVCSCGCVFVCLCVCALLAISR